LKEEEKEKDGAHQKTGTVTYFQTGKECCKDSQKQARLQLGAAIQFVAKEPSI
jgi:hypothetical protein